MFYHQQPIKFVDLPCTRQIFNGPWKNIFPIMKFAKQNHALKNHEGWQCLSNEIVIWPQESWLLQAYREVDTVVLPLQRIHEESVCWRFIPISGEILKFKLDALAYWCICTFIFFWEINCCALILSNINRRKCHFLNLIVTVDPQTCN